MHIYISASVCLCMCVYMCVYITTLPLITVLTKCNLLGYTYLLNNILRCFGSCREAAVMVDTECSHAAGGRCHLSCHQNFLSFQICREDAQLITFQAFPTKLHDSTKTKHFSKHARLTFLLTVRIFLGDRWRQ